jgi:hypothetical protein
MPLGSAVRERVRALLPAGATIRYLFPASVTTSALVVVHVLVVVTDAEILVLYTGFWSRTRPKSVWLRYQRQTRLGPVDTSATPEFSLGEYVFEIDGQYVPVVNAADAERGPAAALPPDPLPDL